MGWSSWNRFAVDVSEYLVKDIVEAMIEAGMREAGYMYVNLDDGWMAKTRDEDGNLRGDPDKFPSGIKALADYLNRRGFKLGLYGDGGRLTCQRYPGNLDHEEQDARLYASWGVDYFKEDWCYSEGLEKKEKYTLMRDCLRKSGRPIVFSICTASFPGAWVTDVGHLWRTTGDITNSWYAIPPIIDTNGELAGHAGPGHWNDPDMLQVGNGGLTDTECRSHFGMWCIMAAPLIAGNDVRNMSEETRKTLTAPELIEVDQDPLGVQGSRVKRQGEGEVWVKPMSGEYKAVALFNRGPEPQEIAFSWPEIGLPGKTAEVRNLWQRRDLGPFEGGFAAEVAPHDTVVLCVFSSRKRPDTPNHAPLELRCEGVASSAGVPAAGVPAAGAPAAGGPACRIMAARGRAAHARSARPWFRWSFECFDIVHRQQACRILVSDAREALEQEKGNVWDSGRQERQDTWVRYAGPELAEGVRYFWKVRVWDSWKQASRYSEVAEFVFEPDSRTVPAPPQDLRCGGEEEPTELMDYPPELSWRFLGTGEYQTAFRLLVSDSRDALSRDEANLWDTGKRYSLKQSIIYSGKGLGPGMPCYWKIMTWGSNRLPGPFSATASFTMAEAPGYNLLHDGSFENDGYGWHGVTHTDRAVVTTEAREGGKSLEMRSNRRFGRRTYQDVAIEGGQVYLAESWMKTRSADGILFTLFWLKDPIPKGVPVQDRAVGEDTVAAVDGSQDWTLYSGRFKAPDEAKVVRFQITMGPSEAQGRIWIDNNRLVEAEKAGL
jgi:alpha-galactosidase